MKTFFRSSRPGTALAAMAATVLLSLSANQAGACSIERMPLRLLLPEPCHVPYPDPAAWTEAGPLLATIVGETCPPECVCIPPVRICRKMHP